MVRKVDLLIIGGGLTGATLLLAMQRLGYSTLLLEASSFEDKIDPDFDARSLALSPATQKVLNTLGVWSYLQDFAVPIDLIHVSDQHRFGASRLTGAPNSPLGYVVEMQYINSALHRLLPVKQLMTPATLVALDQENRIATITTPDGEVQIQAKLIVAADGARSAVRSICQLPAKTKDYHQQAIVANIGLDKPHEYKAYERFTKHGPIAMLPMQGKKMSLVWANPTDKAERLMVLSDAAFLSELQKNFGYRLGRFVKVGKRFTYPLKQVLMPKQAQWPVVFVGNAAHTLHPVAGQGFNLGVRDVAALAQSIKIWGLNPEMLNHYIQSRTHDQKVITRFTDGLIHLFNSRVPGIGIARNMGLIALDTIPALKNLLARYAQGYGGVIPDLVCEIALDTQEVDNDSTI